MGFFQSPKTLIGVLKNKDTIDAIDLKQEAQWFRSAEGRVAYNAANTLLKKTVYFYNYLTSIASQKDNNSDLYGIAFVMADAMDQSSLEFAGYPNILDAEKNPLVEFVSSDQFKDGSKYDRIGFTAQLLCAFHKDKEPEDFILPDRNPLDHLTPRNADGSFSDMYKIERDIIWTFNKNNSDKFSVGPFNYDIIPRAEKEEE